MKTTLDLYVHWLWSITFGLLALSGFALMGAQFGWILNYDLATADYIHRTLSALLVILLLAAIVMEILRLLTGFRVTVWMMVGIESFQLFTLVTTLLLIISGLFIWVCMEFSKVATTFCLMIHEIVSYLALGSIIWHMYHKAFAIRIK